MPRLNSGLNKNARALTKQDLYDILNGACILGCGGGGPLTLGKQLLAEVIPKGTVHLIDPKAVGDDELMAIAAGVGSPLAATAGFPFDVVHIAFKALDQIQSKLSGKSFSFVLPGEVGAGNSVIPMTVAVLSKLPIVDGDGARRAIPELDMVTYASQNVPISPIVLANQDETISFTAANAQIAGVTTDGIINGGAFKEDAGIAMWTMRGATMKTTVIPNTMSYARDLGAALRKAISAKKDPVEAVCRYLQGTLLFTGKITNTQQSTSGGFDFGTITLQNRNAALTIYNQNENLIAWSSKSIQPLVMAPDLICYLTTEGQPFSNADLQLAKNKEVAVIAAPCASQMHAPSIVAAFQVSLAKMGYAGQHAWLSEL
jgi:uncharacterized protein